MRVRKSREHSTFISSLPTLVKGNFGAGLFFFNFGFIFGALSLVLSLVQGYFLASFLAL
jgi:hypothetical protein